MPFENMFKFVSQAERKQLDRDFRKKIFPLGPAQKDLALNAIRPLIKTKIRDDLLLFAFISAKEKFVDISESAAYDYLKKQKQFTDKEKAYLMALVLLDTRAESPERYPTDDDIVKEAREFLSQLADK